MNTVLINKKDNVIVALENLKTDSVIDSLILKEDIKKGHKVAIQDIKKGEKIIKYGYPIGYASQNIAKGEHVHTHNVKTLLRDGLSYSYDEELAKTYIKKQEERFKNINSIPKFLGYERKNNEVGIRNSLWIIPTVGCVNRIALKLESWANENLKIQDKALALTHPFGCSQMGEDHENTRNILSSLAHHPNAGGILIIALGCENNTLESFMPLLKDIDESRIKFLVCQEEDDEVEKGKLLLKELESRMIKDERKSFPLSKLKFGFKCGGSDGLSGLTANPLVGMFCDCICTMNASALLTEVPEMFGAEQILMNRARNKEVFEKIVTLINNFKNYFTSHNQVVYENPSPGNKEGGITTLEDKSLGCVQKGGESIVEDVINYGERLKTKGLTLLSGPGNDIVSTTAQAAAGAHIILFTTGRGTPLGSPVPTVKISTNNELFDHKKNWMDFNAARLLQENKDSLLKEFIEYIVKIASGEKTNNEKNNYMEISIFKDGVIL